MMEAMREACFVGEKVIGSVGHKQRFLMYEGFVSVHLFEAICQTKEREDTLALEVRKWPDGNMQLFTILDGQPIKTSSFQEFIRSQSECRSLILHHEIPISWQETARKANLLEIFRCCQGESQDQILIQLILTVDGNSYETTLCDTLQDAQRELDEIVGSDANLWLRTCSQCDFGGWPALPGPGWDDRDDIRCYRDAPPAVFAEVKEKRKFASDVAKNSGHYFVHAFHTCAAWCPLS